MSFFSRLHTPTSAFPSDIFRVLDELNQFSSSTAGPSTGNRRAFSPNFDIHETDSAFVLEGELPGLEDKSKINIEFTDDNTLLVRGKVEKSITRTSPNTESKAAESKAAEKSTPTAEDNNIETQVAQRPNDSQKAVGKPADGYRYWVSERSVGEFQRSFSFPGTVDIEAVKASLEHGILKIVVPKKEVIKGRKIEIA